MAGVGALGSEQAAQSRGCALVFTSGRSSWPPLAQMVRALGWLVPPWNEVHRTIDSIAKADVRDVNLVLYDSANPNATWSLEVVLEKRAQARAAFPGARLIVLIPEDDAYMANALGLAHVQCAALPTLDGVALERLRAHLKNIPPPEGPRPKSALACLVGQSLPMRRVRDLVERIALTDASVLIEGETGTGKELIARAIHERSRRKDRRYLVVDCGALHPSTLESELFGHRKGAFTDASESRPGLLRSATGGTVFLDEIGEMRLDAQPTLLRFLQERGVRPVGEVDSVQIDVRVVAATNRDLEHECREGRFRLDLFYRLAISRLYVPPLRDRLDDVPDLARHFFFTALCERDTPKPSSPEKAIRISESALDLLQQQRWEGNVRALQAVMQRVIQLRGAADPDSQIEREITEEEITLALGNRNSTQVENAASVPARARACEACEDARLEIHLQGERWRLDRDESLATLFWSIVCHARHGSFDHDNGLVKTTDLEAHLEASSEHFRKWLDDLCALGLLRPVRRNSRRGEEVGKPYAYGLAECFVLPATWPTGMYKLKQAKHEARLRAIVARACTKWPDLVTPGEPLADSAT